jgi:hypothetical protein
MSEDNKIKSAFHKVAAMANYNRDPENVKPWDLVNPKSEFVDTETSDQRYQICKTCPDFIKLTTQCKKCGCFMKAKTTLEKATCPIGKW